MGGRLPRPIADRWGRTLRYLRVSVTDRCNLRCCYCMPAQGAEMLPREGILSYEQIAAVVRAAVALGVTSVRLTGGEPLVRRDLATLVRLLRAVPGLRDLSMTTNGILLAAHAEALARAGLRRVNISIDSFDPREYGKITRGGDLRAALDGVRAALAAGLTPVKVNAVMFAERNDAGLRRWMEGFLRLARELRVHVRFIEHMPIGRAAGTTPAGDVIVRTMEALGARPVDGEGVTDAAQSPHAITGAGPARYWRLDGAPGLLGLIAPMSAPFCDRCNRLRLTARGELRRCVFSPPEFDLRPLLSPRVEEEAVAETLSFAWMSKPPGRGSAADDAGGECPSPHRAPISMCQIGG